MGWAVTRLSPSCSPYIYIYIAQRNQRIAMHTLSLEKLNPVPLILRLRHYIYRTNSPSLAFGLMLSVQVNNGFAVFQNHVLDYLEIHQFVGVIFLD